MNGIRLHYASKGQGKFPADSSAPIMTIHPGWTESALGLAYLQKKERARAERILEEMLEKRRRSHVCAVTIAWLAAALGNVDLAFRWLEHAFDERDILMAFIHIYTDFLVPELLSDLRFKNLLVKMKLTDLMSLPPAAGTG